MKALLLTFFLTLSCTRYSSLSKNAVGLVLGEVQTEIVKLDEIPWNVGKRKEVEISQGFTFLLEMPKLRSQDFDFLEKERGVDAWIIRVIQVQGSKSQDLGSLYTHFKPRILARGVSVGAAKYISIKVSYAASYASERFRAFKCPSFGHDKVITSLSVKGNNDPFDMNISSEIHYNEKSQLSQLTPNNFNGGNDLRGEYYLELAPYNSRTKKIYSNFKRLPQYIDIATETRISIPSCKGVNEELN